MKSYLNGYWEAGYEQILYFDNYVILQLKHGRIVMAKRKFYSELVLHFPQ